MSSKIATSVPTDNNLSVKDLELEIEEMWHLQTTSNASNNGSPGYDRERNR